MSRGNGEGTIYRDSTGRYRAIVSLPGDSREKRRRKYLYGKTRADAASKMIEFQKKLLDGSAHLGPDPRLDAYIRAWLEGKNAVVKPTTHRRYKDYVELHIIPELGQLKLSRVTAPAIRSFYTSRLSVGLSAQSVKHLHRVFSQALSAAEADGVIAKNPARHVKPPRVLKREIEAFTEDELRSILHTASGNPLEALYVTALTTGLRQGELLGLRWQDIDLKIETLHVRRSLMWVGGKPILDSPKTESSQRQVRLSPPAVVSLRRHRAAQNERRLRLADIWRTDHDLVFTNEVGGPVNQSNLSKRGWRRLLENAGVRYRNFNTTRHTAATILLKRGVHPKVVQEMLGHSSIMVTLDVYSHVIPDMQQTAADAMAEVLAV